MGHFHPLSTFCLSRQFRQPSLIVKLILSWQTAENDIYFQQDEVVQAGQAKSSLKRTSSERIESLYVSPSDLFPMISLFFMFLYHQLIIRNDYSGIYG